MHPARGRNRAVGRQQVRCPQFRYCVRAHLQLEADQALRDLRDNSWDCSGAVFLRSGPGHPVQDGVQVGAGAHRRVDGEDIWIAEAGRDAQAGDESFLGEPDHLLNDLAGGVVGPRLLAQLVVVQVQEVLVQVQVGVVPAAADPRPVHRADHADEQIQGDPEICCHVVGEQLQRFAHQGVITPQGCPDLVQRLPGHVDALGTGQQQGERDGLSVPVGEGGIAGLREQQSTPVAGQPREGLRVLICACRDELLLGCQLVEHLAAQQPGQRGDVPDQRADGGYRLRLPAQEAGQQAFQAGGCQQGSSCCREVSSGQGDRFAERVRRPGTAASGCRWCRPG